MKIKVNGYTFEVAELYRLTYPTGNLAIYMEDEDGDELGVLTVNLPRELPLKDNRAFVDTSNLGEGAVKFIEDNNLGVPTGIIAKSGYTEYPLYEFDLSKFKEFE